MIQLRTDNTGQQWADVDDHGENRRTRWRRRRRAVKIAYTIAPGRDPQEESPLKRLKSCGMAKAKDVVIRSHDGHAHASGLMNCGNIWTCPPCAARIRARRELEVEAALAKHCAAGGQLGMMTLTLRHHRGDGLAQSIDRLNNAWARLQRFHRYKPLYLALNGSITTLEITLGPNGWHPHLHIIMLTGSDRTHAEMIKLTSNLRASWSDLVNANTDRFTIAHGLNLIWFGRDSKAAAKYVTKLAKEITLNSTKSGNDPFTLLDRDDDEATALFIEYAYATYRRQAHRWSNNLKGSLHTDDELNDDDTTTGVEVLTISRELWNSITDEERLAWLEFAEAQHQLSGP